MLLPRPITLDDDAVAALLQLVGIMTDQVLIAEDTPRWQLEDVMTIEARLEQELAFGNGVVTLGIDDVGLLLDGMAFTESASSDLPWAELVRWTSDFIAAELRQYWTEHEWQRFAQRS